MLLSCVTAGHSEICRSSCFPISDEIFRTHQSPQDGGEEVQPMQNGEIVLMSLKTELGGKERQILA